MTSDPILTDGELAGIEARAMTTRLMMPNLVGDTPRLRYLTPLLTRDLPRLIAALRASRMLNEELARGFLEGVAALRASRGELAYHTNKSDLATAEAARLAEALSASREEVKRLREVINGLERELQLRGGKR